MWSHSKAPKARLVFAAAAVASAFGACRPPATEHTKSPYVEAADRFGTAYCELAFSDGCSVPEECGVPAAFADRSDCRFRLIPFLWTCAVPDPETDSVIEALNACSDVMESTTCANPLCGAGTLDTDPCRSVIEALASHCAYEGL
ncbi:MAG: hypothetical protein CL927_04830 [Deltaproteobacteria bacterium]|nr:hypothetical protein [Deltaproteobacteria bacterium]HCH64036.1 hypothetical protein [Deltaproteobacteria bacterium]